MHKPVDRYDCILDPADRWTVWDRARDVPAELAGAVLYGLQRNLAESLSKLLNQSPRALH